MGRELMGGVSSELFWRLRMGWQGERSLRKRVSEIMRCSLTGLWLMVRQFECGFRCLFAGMLGVI